jgi:hypothetical protein
VPLASSGLVPQESIALLVRWRAVTVFMHGLTHEQYRGMIEGERSAVQRAGGAVTEWTLTYHEARVFAEVARLVAVATGYQINPSVDLRDAVVVRPNLFQKLANDVGLLVDDGPVRVAWDGHGPPVRARVIAQRGPGHDPPPDWAPAAPQRFDSEETFSAGRAGLHDDMSYFLPAITLGSERGSRVVSMCAVLFPMFFALPVAPPRRRLLFVCDGHSIDLPFGGSSKKCKRCVADTLMGKMPLIFRRGVRTTKSLTDDYADVIPHAAALAASYPPVVGVAPGVAAMMWWVSELGHTVANVVHDLLVGAGAGVWASVKAALLLTRSGPWTIAIGSSLSLKGLNVELPRLMVSSPQLFGPPVLLRLLERLVGVYRCVHAPVDVWRAVLLDVHEFLLTDPLQFQMMKGGLHRLDHAVESADTLGLDMHMFKGDCVERAGLEMNSEYLKGANGDVTLALARVNAKRALVADGLMSTHPHANVVPPPNVHVLR